MAAIIKKKTPIKNKNTVNEGEFYNFEFFYSICFVIITRYNQTYSLLQKYKIMPSEGKI